MDTVSLLGPVCHWITPRIFMNACDLFLFVKRSITTNYFELFCQYKQSILFAIHRSRVGRGFGSLVFCTGMRSQVLVTNFICIPFSPCLVSMKHLVLMNGDVRLLILTTVRYFHYELVSPLALQFQLYIKISLKKIITTQDRVHRSESYIS